MSSTYSEITKAVKAGDKKHINVSYTPEIYRVLKYFKKITQDLKEKDII